MTAARALATFIVAACLAPPACTKKESSPDTGAKQLPAFLRPGAKPADARASYQRAKLRLLEDRGADCEALLGAIVAFNRKHGKRLEGILTGAAVSPLPAGVEHDVRIRCPRIERDILQALASHRVLVLKRVPPEDPATAAMVNRMQAIIRIVSENRDDCRTLNHGLAGMEREQQADWQACTARFAERVKTMSAEDRRWLAIELAQYADPFITDNAKLLEDLNSRCPEVATAGRNLLVLSNLVRLVSP